MTTKVPSPFVALIWTTALVQSLGIPIETIGSRFGAIDASFPAFHIPAISLDAARALLRDLSRKSGAGGFTLVLSEVQPQPMKAIKDSRLLDVIGIDNCVPDIELAMVRVQALISEPRTSPQS